jgi:hypothetical protein
MFWGEEGSFVANFKATSMKGSDCVAPTDGAIIKVSQSQVTQEDAPHD